MTKEKVKTYILEKESRNNETISPCTKRRVPESWRKVSQERGQVGSVKTGDKGERFEHTDSERTRQLAGSSSRQG